MRELRELSKLPADPAYWVGLEARMRGSGAGGQRGSKKPDWWEPVAIRAVGLSGLAIAAGVAALLLVPPRARGGATNPAVLFRLPDDPAMAAFLSSPAPPSVGTILVSYPRSTP